MYRVNIAETERRQRQVTAINRRNWRNCREMCFSPTQASAERVVLQLLLQLAPELRSGEPTYQQPLGSTLEDVLKSPRSRIIDHGRAELSKTDTMADPNDDDDLSPVTCLKEGILEKKHPHTGYFHLRYVRLTESMLSWYEDVQGTLQRGVVSLTAIESVVAMDYDKSLFQLNIIDRKPIVFRCLSVKAADEWRSTLSAYQGSGRIICSGISEMEIDIEPVLIEKIEILQGKSTEFLLDKSYWGQSHCLMLHHEHAVRCSLNNGASVELSYSTMDQVARGIVEKEFPLSGPDLRPQTLAMSIEIVQDTSLSPKNIASPQHTAPPIDVLGFVNRQKFYLLGGVALRIAIGFLTRGTTQVLLSSGLAMAGLGALFLTHTSSATQLKTTTFTLVLKRHQYLSEAIDDPDPPSKDLEDPIPRRFVNGCDGNIEEAKRRWEATSKWRQEQRGDHV